MKGLTYEQQRERLAANVQAHELMLCWYAKELGVTRSNVISKLSSISSKQAQQLYTKYQEHL